MNEPSTTETTASDATAPADPATTVAANEGAPTAQPEAKPAEATA